VNPFGVDMDIPLARLRITLPILLCSRIKFLLEKLGSNWITARLLAHGAFGASRSVLVIGVDFLNKRHTLHGLS
jgi:hypothetical protein